MILCDAGVLLCLVDPRQPLHNAYKATVLRIAKPLITSWSCLTEAMYLALHRGGWKMQNSLGKMLCSKLVVIESIPESSYERLMMLMDQYHDRPMDLADATLVVIAEKLGIREILTLDSDFLFYRVAGNDSFEVIPALI